MIYNTYEELKLWKQKIKNALKNWIYNTYEELKQTNKTGCKLAIGGFIIPMRN